MILKALRARFSLNGLKTNRLDDDFTAFWTRGSLTGDAFTRRGVLQPPYYLFKFLQLQEAELDSRNLRGSSF